MCAYEGRFNFSVTPKVPSKQQPNPMQSRYLDIEIVDIAITVVNTNKYSTDATSNCLEYLVLINVCDASEERFKI